MNQHIQVAAQKSSLRRQIRAGRRELDTSYRRRAVQGFTHGLRELTRNYPAGPVMAFLPTPEEPPLTEPLQQHLVQREVWLPRTGPRRRLSWVRWHRETTFSPTGPGALPEPTGTAGEAPSSSAFVLVPALAVDTDGIRLGMGGGYYDTFLAQLDPSVPRVACVFDHEVLPAGRIPAEAWDARMDVILTQNGLRQIRA